MTFKTDLKFGHKYEFEALKYLDYLKYEHTPNIKNKGYDIKLFKKDNKEEYIEVKADRYIHKTGNICIEYNCFGKMSGISTTTSNIYIIFSVKNNIIDEVFKIPTETLKEYIKNNNPISRNLGFNGQAKCYLINKEVFKDYRVNLDQQ